MQTTSIIPKPLNMQKIFSAAFTRLKMTLNNYELRFLAHR
jgi:hypothetical protein